MQRVTYPERILIVLNQDGSLKGAHLERLDQVIVEGEVVSTRQMTPEPLDSSALSIALPTQGALMADLIAAQSSIDEKQALVDEKTTALAQAETQIETLDAQITSLNTQIASLNAEVAAQTAAKTTAETELASATTQIAPLNAQLASVAAQAEAQIAALNLQIATLNAQIAALQNPPVDPTLSCTDLQFRLALNQLGLRESVEAYVASTSQDVRDWWERATIIHANSPMLIEAATALGKTQADIDAVIELGRTLT